MTKTRKRKNRRGILNSKKYKSRHKAKWRAREKTHRHQPARVKRVVRERERDSTRRARETEMPSLLTDGGARETRVSEKETERDDDITRKQRSQIERACTCIQAGETSPHIYGHARSKSNN